MKNINKIQVSTTPPKDTNVLWITPDNIKCYMNGTWKTMGSDSKPSEIEIKPQTMEDMNTDFKQYTIDTDARKLAETVYLDLYNLRQNLVDAGILKVKEKI